MDRSIGNLQDGQIIERDRGPLPNTTLIRLEGQSRPYTIPLTEENLDLLEYMVEAGRREL